MSLSKYISEQIALRKFLFTGDASVLRDFFGNVIENENDYYKEKEMTNEQIRNEINEATRDFRETTRKVNEALNHAAGRLDKAEKEAYDRGLNDCWEMVKKIKNIGYLERKEIFPLAHGTFISDILDDYGPQQSLAKIRAWEEKKAEEERKKQEETEKIQIGDVVKMRTLMPYADIYEKGIVVGSSPNGFDNSIMDYLIWMREYDVPQLISPRVYEIKKTGKHINILETLREE